MLDEDIHLLVTLPRLLMLQLLFKHIIQVVLLLEFTVLMTYFLWW